jgi:hypothetical protein
MESVWGAWYVHFESTRAACSSDSGPTDINNAQSVGGNAQLAFDEQRSDEFPEKHNKWHGDSPFGKQGMLLKYGARLRGKLHKVTLQA